MPAFAIGDIQTRFDTFLAILRARELLGKNARLDPSVRLIACGDYFDFPHEDPAEAGRDGLRILRWLAAHPPEQVTILLGNHDLCRLQELGSETDTSFARARALARQLRALPKHSAERRSLEARFREEHPAIPTPGIAARDFSAFLQEQRAVLADLIQTGRARLAKAARFQGQDILLTHAGITTRELAILELDGQPKPAAIAERLNRFLQLRAQAADDSPLDLRPLHIHGVTDKEGGGLLYHRPAAADPTSSWKFDPERPRRFTPAEALPPGLLQACGHSNHRFCLKELHPAWIEAREQQPGRLRCLRVRADEVRYLWDTPKLRDDEAGLIMIDGDMHRCPPRDYQILPLEGP